jgi:hypothetical protein
MKGFENEYVNVWIEEGILYCTYKDQTVIDLPIAIEIVKDRLTFSEGKAYPILIDFSNLKSVTKEARDYMNSPEGGLNGLVCGAFVGGNAVATFFINVYLKINRPSIPTVFFTDRNEAINWLKNFINDFENDK